MVYDYNRDMLRGPDGQFPQKLRGLPSDLVERITNEIMTRDTNVRWDDIGISDTRTFFTHYKCLAILIRL